MWCYLKKDDQNVNNMTKQDSHFSLHHQLITLLYSNLIWCKKSLYSNKFEWPHYRRTIITRRGRGDIKKGGGNLESGGRLNPKVPPWTGNPVSEWKIPYPDQIYLDFKFNDIGFSLVKKLSIKLQRSSVRWTLRKMIKSCPYTCRGLEFEIIIWRGSENCPFTCRGLQFEVWIRKLSIKLKRSSVWATHLSFQFVLYSENCPFTCRGLQFEV